MTYTRLLPLAFACAFSIVAVKAQTERDRSVQISVSEGTNFCAALSPDKKTLAIDLQGTIWTMAAAGGKATSLTDDLGDCHEPTWSPDGNTIAFHSYRNGNYHIWTIRKDGTQLKQITTGLSDNREPCWSLDGRKIFFSSDRSGNYDIWEIKLSDHKIKALTHDPANDYYPSISPSGEKLAFVSERKEPGVYVLENNKETLVASSNARITSPWWARGGNDLLFTIYETGKSKVVRSGKTKDSATVVVEGEDIFPFKGAWVDHNTFLYTADGRIFKRQLNTTRRDEIKFEAQLIINRSAYKRREYDFDESREHPAQGMIGPVVSPDGTSVAFGALGDIYIQKVRGALTRITNTSAVEADPDWSPDGRQLAFISDRDGHMNVWIHDLPSGQTKQVVRNDGNGIAGCPSWSRDGRKIAFFFRDDQLHWGRWILKVLDISSGKVQQLPSTYFFPSKPSWSADGKVIAFMAPEVSSTRYREGLNKFLLVSLSDSTTRFLESSSSQHPGIRAGNGPAFSPDGTSIAYTDGGKLWIMPVSETKYGQPNQVLNSNADKISWTGDSKSIVYLEIDQLKKLDLATGTTFDIPITLTWQPRHHTGSYVIHAGRMLNGIDSTYINDVDIIVERNRIRQIKQHGQHSATTQVIDASAFTVMPGLIEGHTHQHVTDGEQLGKIWLSNGITSVRETGSDPYDGLERKESWASGARVGPRSFFTGPLMDGNRVYYGLSSNVDTAEIRFEMTRASRLGYDLIKTYVRMRDETQKMIIAEAHKLGLPMSSHELYPAAKYNADGVEHLAGTSRRGYSTRQSILYKTYDDVHQLTIRSGINITPTIVMGGFLKMTDNFARLDQYKQYHAFFSKEYIDAWKKRAATSDYGFVDDFQKTIRIMHSGGANVIAGTDSPMVPYGTSLHGELWLFVQAGLTPFEALQSATIRAARAMGIDRDLGSIEAGKLADLVMVSGDPLNDISDATNVEMVVKDGTVYRISELMPQR